MDNSEMFSSSTVQHTWHDFLDRMRQPSAAEFVKAIKSFIVSFSNNSPDPEKDSAAVQQFFAKMEAAFRAHPLWSGCSEEELESAGEGLEKYVMTKLFPRVFASFPDDVKIDEQLTEKIALVQQFIRPENLDIKPPFQNESSWLLAQKELQKINMYKAPREKLACILNCCKVITNLLHNAAVTANEDTPGADEFLPVLIYVTIKANPPQLHLNLQYIQRYRRESRLVSETAYYFTNILSAVSFISNIDAQALSMDENEFERNMDSAQALLSGLTTDFQTTTNTVDNTSSSKPPMEEFQQTFSSNSDSTKQSQTPLDSSASKSSHLEDPPSKDQSPMTKNMSISDLEEKGATMILKEDRSIDNVFQEFPYVFASVGDLTLRDVEDLLSNYKQLVFKYVCLAKGKGVAPSLSTSSFSQALDQGLVETGEGSEPGKEIETGPGKEIETDEHQARKPDSADESSHSDMVISESKSPHEDADASLQEEERNEDLVSPKEDSEDKEQQEDSAAPLTEEPQNDVQ
ncbi:vacuolar protein sorting-associated protein 9A-like isoform X1 [Chenopodium quinoa]|uniref:Vacuolar protein sorting-associated protein 9A n=2 Tax=Chenopodium quinoa TaxID=63459 RepID=A0A803L078_CHEQI|nr:vacuolar protein sorting-associated protein 9A-like isoform X1 [Chenopodium quinoa]